MSVNSARPSLGRSLKVILGLLLILPAIPSSLYGDNLEQKPADLAAIVDQVEAYYKSLKDFEARFTQVARILSYPEDQNSEGKVYIRRNQMMRWDYEKPSQEQYYIQGETVIYYSPEVKQARRISLAGKGGIRSPLVFFEGLKKAEADYVIAMNTDPIFDRSTRHILQLTPRKAQEVQLHRILIFVNKSQYHVERIDQYDLHGNVTELYFKDVKINQDLPDSLFAFKAPEGVQIIDQP
ncbi:MAG: outer membrane lipoprotein carrier protein LolA [bacterium]|nr:outer membrane lipoprotein carrier protein LolA [bacterium]